MWDAVAVTCSTNELAAVVQEDLDQLVKCGILSSETLLLALEDPRSGIGSGGATINALFVMCEHFCVRENLTVINFDMLMSKRLLIIHAGRDFVYEPLAGIFLPLPVRYKAATGCDFPVTNLHWILNLLTQRIPDTNPSGVWVLSGDLVLDFPQELDVSDCSGQEIIAFSFPVDKSVALRNGVYDTDEDGYLKEILYQGSPKRIDEVRRLGDDGRYPLVVGFVYLPLRMAEQLLKLYSHPPLDACTYMGIDSGAQPICVSLFFDILASMGSQSRNTDDSDPANAFNLMREVLHKCRVRIAHVSQGNCIYLTKREDEVEELVNDLCRQSALSAFEFVKKPRWGQAGLSEKEEAFLAAIKMKKLKAWRRRVPQFPGGFVWKIIHEEFDEEKIGDETTSEFLSRTGIAEDDIWENSSTGTSQNARLFPVCPSTDAVKILTTLFLSECSDESVVAQWRRTTRLSLMEMQVDLQREYLSRREWALKMAELRVEEVINTPPFSSCPQMSLRPTLTWAVSTDCIEPLLHFMDGLACRFSSKLGLVARTLAAIADLLGEGSRKRGGLRSGPASNFRWLKALGALHDDLIESGIHLLAEERGHWMDTPTRMIRASRHYERAAQILISKAVQTVQTYIRATRDAETTYRSVTVECPARVDVAGAWSDTPPICYEGGGATVNISLLVNGQFPIGARVEKIEEPVFRVSISGRSEVIIRTPDEISDYSNPVSPAALVKAALVFAEITDPSRGGLKISTWSNLPQGSGLGTSSILTAALLTALWTVGGWKFTMSDVIHGVLIVEQLMTTGGGWQDQIGGLGLGFLFGSSPAELPLQVHHEKINVDPAVVREINSRLALIYSGKTRLAKNLLHDVVRNWYARDETVSQNVMNLLENAKRCRDALLRGDIEEFFHSVEAHRIQKSIMAPGSETIPIKRQLAALEPLTSGKVICGAGGGGFIVGFLKPGVTREQLETTIAEFKKDAAELQQEADMELYECEIQLDGMKITTES